MELNGAVALVTGGNGGLGQRICHALAQEGVHLAVMYARSRDQAEGVVGELASRYQINARAFGCDITDDAAVDRLVGEVTHAFGRLDILINDAAYNLSIPFNDLDSLTQEVWDKIMAVNLTGPMRLTKAVAPIMKAQGQGRIVNIASVAGLSPTGSSIAYAVSKAGLIHLTKCMAVALAPETLVNCVAPGLLDGTRATANLKPEQVERSASASLLKKPADKDDCADMVVAMCRTETMTGQSSSSTPAAFFTEVRSMVVWSPFRFNCGREMANRFAIAPLTTDASHEDGTVSDHELEFVRRRAAGGFGATISSAAYVADDGRSWQGIGAAHDGHLSSLHRLAEAMRAAGGLAILQIYDGGRIAIPKLIGDERLRAASAVASLRPGAQTPRAMTSDEVEGLIASFREAASLARKARFDGVEIHGANHYAVHQFFSPRANHRDDRWGGTLAKRMNFPLAVAQAVRDALGPDLIAGYRVTPFEAESDGYTLDDSKLLCGELAKLNLDYISVSLDDYRKNRPTGEVRVYNGPVDKSYSLAESPITEFARIIAGRAAVMASGGIKTCTDAEGAIAMGADLVAIGRAVVVDPEWFAKVRSKNEASILAGLPKDEGEIAGALSIPPRMVDYLLSRPGWIPRL